MIRRARSRGWNALAIAALINAGLVVVLDHVFVHFDPLKKSAAAPPPGPLLLDDALTGAPADIAVIELVGPSPPAIPLEAILGAGDDMAFTGLRPPRPHGAELPGAQAADRGGGADGGTATWTDRRDRADDAALRSRIWNSPDAYRAPRAPGARRAATPEAIDRAPDHAYGDRTPRPIAAAGEATRSIGDETGTGNAGIGVLAGAPEVTRGASGATTPARAPGATQVAREGVFADVGTTAVDVQRHGAPAGDRAVAAASNQRNTDPYDLTPPRSGGDRDGEGVAGPTSDDGQLAGGWGRGTAASRGDVAPGDGGAPTFATRQDRYFTEMFRRLDRSITYPHDLALNMISGRVVAIMTLRADGAIAGIAVHASSGHTEFDQELVAALRGLGKLPRVPAALLDGKPELRVMIPYTFRNPMIQ